VRKRIIVVVVPTDVVGILRKLPLFLKGTKHRAFDPIPAGRVDRVSDISKHSRLAAIRPHMPGFRKAGAAIAAESSSDLVLAGTANALFHQFSTGHRNEVTALTLDNLQVTYDELTIERD